MGSRRLDQTVFGWVRNLAQSVGLRITYRGMMMDMVIVMVVSIMSTVIVILVMLLQTQLRRNKVQENLITSYEVIMSLWRREKSQQRLAKKLATVLGNTKEKGVTLPPLSKTDRLWVRSYD
jgi:hypothetical protein|tara:strand:+ start:308 stop:670 length:363 start_codon:yes stop_codon:yes gene_type:complete